jgi:hypothetical protein
MYILTKVILYLFYCVVIARLECPHTGLCNLGNRFIRLIFKVFHIEDQALFVGQCEQCLLQAALDVVARQPRLLVELATLLLGHVADGQKEPALFASQKIQAFVGGDAVHPGVQPGIFPKAVDVLVDLNKNLLGQVVGIVVIDNHLPDMAVDALLVRPHQQVKPVVPGFGVPDLCQKLFVLQGNRR